MQKILLWGCYTSILLLLTPCNTTLTNSSRALFANSAVEFMKRHPLDGVDIDWEYSEDAKGVLLNTLFTQLRTSDEM